MSDDDLACARLVVRRPALGRPVLERIVAALAARVDLPIDRLSDAQIVSAAVAASARRHSADGSLAVELMAHEGELELVVGPLPAGAGARVVADSALPGIGVVVERLVDRWEVERLDGGERLRLRIGAGTPASAG
jgi:hypothetical protein